MNEFFYGTICLSDIPKELIRKSEKNGKQYISIAISQLKEPSKFGDTHVVTMNIPKDQRQPTDKTHYIGNLKTWKENGASRPQSQQAKDDDLPF